MQTQMLIGSDFEAGSEVEETVLNPRTGETILQMPEASPAQIDRAVAAAEAAFSVFESALAQTDVWCAAA